MGKKSKKGGLNYAEKLKPRIVKLQKAGISLNDLFDRAEVARSNWSRWSNDNTSPTLKTHERFIAAIEGAEKEVERKKRIADEIG